MIADFHKQIVILFVIGITHARHMDKSGWHPSGPPPPPLPNTSIGISGDVTGIGSGLALEHHSENLQVVGGWGVPADVQFDTAGDALIFQQGSATQGGNVESQSASGFNGVSFGQGVAADENANVIANGLSIAYGQTGWTNVAGQGSSETNGGINVSSS